MELNQTAPRKSVLRRYGTLLCLGLLLLGTGGYLYFSRGTPGGTAAGDERVVPDAALQAAQPPDGGDDADVRAIRARLQIVLYTRQAAAVPPWRVISLRRYEFGGRPEWWIDSPHLRADDTACEGMYGTLLSTTVRRRLGGAQGEAAKYGLSDDRYRMRVVLRGGFELRLGDETQDGLVYAASNRDKDVVAVDRHLLEVLSGDRAHYNKWSLGIADFIPAEVKTLQLGMVKLSRRPSGWEAEEGTGPARRVARARTELVEQALAALRSARAVKHLEGPGMMFNEDPHWKPGSSMVKLDGKIQLYDGLACPGEPELALVLRGDGGRLCFKTADVAPLMQTLEALREQRLVPFAEKDVRRVQVADLPAAGDKVELQKQPDGTFALDGKPADGDAARGFVRDLLAVTGTAPAAPVDKAPLARGGGRLEVETAAGDLVKLQVLGEVRGSGQVLVQRGDEMPLSIGQEAFAVVREAGLRLRSLRLLAVRADLVRELKVERPGLTEVVRRERAVGPMGEGWVLHQPVEVPADVDLMTRLLGLFGDLRAERLAALAALPEHGLAQPAARFTLTLSEGAQQVVELGAARGAGCYVRSPTSALGGAAVGELGDRACADLGSLLGTTALLIVDDARVSRVTWRERGKQRTLVQQGSGFAIDNRDASRFAIDNRDASRFAIDGQPGDPGEVLGTLHRLHQAKVIGYGPPPQGLPAAAWSARVEQKPAPAGAAPTSSVAPELQEVAVYEGTPPHRSLYVAWLSGRPVRYQVPETQIWPALGPL